jgi:hypothetical protein
MPPPATDYLRPIRRSRSMRLYTQVGEVEDAQGHGLLRGAEADEAFAEDYTSAWLTWADRSLPAHLFFASSHRMQPTEIPRIEHLFFVPHRQISPSGCSLKGLFGAI